MIALALAGMVATTDGVNIAYDHYKNGFDSVVIVCPGFFNSKKNSFMKKTVEIVSSSYDVIIFDFRGHGESGSKFTWTSTEPLDLGAVLDYAAGCGYKKDRGDRFSLGAATAMNVAVNRPEIKSMILISAPFSFWDMNYHFWEPEMLSDLMANFECKWEGKGAKLDNIFLPKVKPIKSVAEIKEIPMLFIHGDRDWVIKDYHSRKLYDAAVTKNKRLAILHNGFHAERLIEKYPDRMKELMLGWFKETLL